MNTTYTEPSTARDDITVWKILYSTRSGFKYTPYQGTRVRNVHLFGEKPFKAVGNDGLEYSKGVLKVGGGFVHAYDTLDKAVSMMPVMRFLTKGRIYTPVLYRCRVKAGTRIYRDGRGSIAAKEIWFEEQVDWEDIEKIYGKT